MWRRSIIFSRSGAKKSLSFLTVIATLALGSFWLGVGGLFQSLKVEQDRNQPPIVASRIGAEQRLPSLPSPSSQQSGNTSFDIIPKSPRPIPTPTPSLPQAGNSNEEARRREAASVQAAREPRLREQELRAREEEAKLDAKRPNAASAQATAQAAAQATTQATEPSSQRSKSDPDADCRRRLRERGVVLKQNAACIDVDTIVKNLASAEYRFNKPDEAFVGEAFRVVLLLPTARGQDVRTPFKSTEGTIERRIAPYAQNMEASLRGDSDLKISPVGPQERVTTSLEPTTWEWTIVSEKSGDKTLVIEVNAQLVLGAERNRVQLRTIYEDIHVHVRWGHWLSIVWNFINSAVGFGVSMATLAIGVLGILHYRRAHKTEDVPGVDLVAHRAAHHEQEVAGGHQPEGH